MNFLVAAASALRKYAAKTYSDCLHVRPYAPAVVATRCRNSSFASLPRPVDTSRVATTTAPTMESFDVHDIDDLASYVPAGADANVGAAAAGAGADATHASRLSPSFLRAVHDAIASELAEEGVPIALFYALLHVFARAPRDDRRQRAVRAVPLREDRRRDRRRVRGDVQARERRRGPPRRRVRRGEDVAAHGAERERLDARHRDVDGRQRRERDRGGRAREEDKERERGDDDEARARGRPPGAPAAAREDRRARESRARRRLRPGRGGLRGEPRRSRGAPARAASRTPRFARGASRSSTRATSRRRSPRTRWTSCGSGWRRRSRRWCVLSYTGSHTIASAW